MFHALIFIVLLGSGFHGLEFAINHKPAVQTKAIFALVWALSLSMLFLMFNQLFRQQSADGFVWFYLYLEILMIVFILPCYQIYLMSKRYSNRSIVLPVLGIMGYLLLFYKTGSAIPMETTGTIF
jgi:hypothetical protein